MNVSMEKAKKTNRATSSKWLERNICFNLSYAASSVVVTCDEARCSVFN